MIRYHPSSEDADIIAALHALPFRQRDLLVQTILRLASQLQTPIPPPPSLHVVRPSRQST